MMIDKSRNEQPKTEYPSSSAGRDPYKMMKDVFGKRYVEYRRAWSALGEDPAGDKGPASSRFPLHLDIDLQDACNQRCVMCHQSYRKRNGAVMTWELLKKVIDEGSENGLCGINFGSSSEPLLQKELLLKGIAYANTKGIMDLFLHTNGTLLDPAFAGLLIDSGLKYLYVSFDAVNAKTYRRTRRSDAYDQVVKNVQDFIEIRKKFNKLFPIVRVSFCVNPSNYTEKERFQEYWKDKVDLVEIQFYQHVDRTSVVGKEFKRMDVHCSNPFRRAMIWPDGELYLCCVYRLPDVFLGNVLEHGISALWNGDAMNKIRDAFKGRGALPSTCKVCLRSNYQAVLL